MGLLWPRCRSQHWELLSLLQLVSAHQSSLSRPLCRAFLPNTPTEFGVTYKCIDGALDALIQIRSVKLEARRWNPIQALAAQYMDTLQGTFLKWKRLTERPSIQLGHTGCYGQFFSFRILKTALQSISCYTVDGNLGRQSRCSKACWPHCYQKQFFSPPTLFRPWQISWNWRNNKRR